MDIVKVRCNLSVGSLQITDLVHISNTHVGNFVSTGKICVKKTWQEYQSRSTSYCKYDVGV